jgi:hypothetical protein
MDERGRLIRDVIPAWLGADRARIAAAVGVPVEDLLIEGRDGTGLKGRVPWVRFAARSMSLHATGGFYVVYLFDAHGDAVFLSLNQGTTDFESGDFRPKAPHVLRARVEWARETVQEWSARRSGLTTLRLHDRRGGLGDGYELGDVASVRYAAGAIPADEALRDDVLVFARALGAVYAEERRTPPPFASPEADLAVAAVEAAAGKSRRSRGAGFRTNAEEIRVVERHAVASVREHYERLGWTVRELGKPYDLALRRNGERLDVEVKGTTSDGMIVTLTDGEVRHHDRVYPHNALVVVSRIALDRSGGTLSASGGQLREIRPWRIDASDLRPIAHRYAVPAPAGDLE